MHPERNRRLFVAAQMTLALVLTAGCTTPSGTQTTAQYRGTHVTSSDNVATVRAQDAALGGFGASAQREGVARVATPRPPQVDPRFHQASLATEGIRQPVPNEAYEARHSYEPTLQQRYPDEYLFDGGDRGLPIHYDRFTRRGVETEDTIVEFVDAAGKRHVKSSNRVAVYAPRFRSVMAVTSGAQGTRALEPFGATSNRSEFALRQRNVPNYQQKNSSANGTRTRSRASGLNTQIANRQYGQRTLPGMTEQMQRAILMRRETAGAMFRSVDAAHLAERIDTASHWTRTLGATALIKEDGVREVKARFEPRLFVGSDDRLKKPAELQIVKAADPKAAQPGDVVTFTIRFRNLGDFPLYHVKIVDNLTPRLEYIDESAHSDVDGSVVVDDNLEGSLVLRFELDNPLAPRSEGFIEFQTTVR